jgi:hypothetical protein
MNAKKYILKPGRHQFAPGSHALHGNDNLTDDDAEWYLQKYPHIAVLFEQMPRTEKQEAQKPETGNSGDVCRVSDAEESTQTALQLIKSPKKSVESQNNEDLFTTN